MLASPGKEQVLFGTQLNRCISGTKQVQCFYIKHKHGLHRQTGLTNQAVEATLLNSFSSEASIVLHCIFL